MSEVKKPDVYIPKRFGAHRIGTRNPNAGRPKGSVKKIPDEKVQEVIRLHNEGYSQIKICTKLDIGIHIVQRILKNADSHTE